MIAPTNPSKTSERSPTWSVGAALLVATAYYLAGRLGLVMAVPPGYVSPVWPASGIAVAAATVLGRTGLAGVALGAFLVNWGFAVSIVDRDPFVAIGVTAGAIAEAALGAYLIRRFVGFPSALDEPKPILRFLGLAGLVAAMVQAAWGPTMLYLGGIIPASSIPTSAATWWAGDALGILVLAPALVLLATPGRTDHLRSAFVIVPTFLAVLGTGFSFSTALARDEEQAGTALREHVLDLHSGLERHLRSDVQLLQSVAALFDASDSVSRSGFHVFAQSQLDEHAIQALEWIPRIDAVDRADFERRQREAGREGFQITERDAEGRVVPAGERDEYFPVVFVEPLAGNEAAVGFDLGSDPDRRRALVQARATGELTASRPVRLVQGGRDEPGYLLFHPVFTSLGSDEAEELRGFALAVFRAGDLVADVRVGPEAEGMLVQLVDRAAGADGLMYSTDGTEILAGPDVLTRSVSLPGRPWSLIAAPTPAFDAVHRTWTPWIVMTTGLALTVLLMAFLLLVTGRTAKVEDIVRARTVELERAKKELEGAIDMSRAHSRELERSNRDLESFAYVASHDLREPIRMVASFTGLLRQRYRGQIDDEADQFIDFAVEGASRMQTLVDDILEYSRVGRGGRPATEVDVEEVVDEITADLLASAEEGTRVTRSDLPVLVGDRVEIRQLFANLVSNGIKFGGEPPVVHVSATEVDGGWEFRVTDNGIGIAEEHMDRVFKIFGRLHTREEFAGTGIGLAICRRVVENADGWMHVESVVGEGSTFVCWLPDLLRASRLAEHAQRGRRPEAPPSEVTRD